MFTLVWFMLPPIAIIPSPWNQGIYACMIFWEQRCLPSDAVRGDNIGMVILVAFVAGMNL
jgi:hypothetical protein